MNALRWLLAPAAVVALALPAMADAIPLATLVAISQRPDHGRKPLTQTNADGSKSKGTLYIKRPGRARFEYDPPMKSLVLASAGSVAIFDEKSNEPPEQYPQRRTPLNLILARRWTWGRPRW